MGSTRHFWAICLSLAFCAVSTVPLARAQGTVPQALDWTDLYEDTVVIGHPFPLAAESSSGLPVTLRVVEGPGTLEDGMLTVTAPGHVLVIAEQPGDETYAPAELKFGFYVPYVVLRQVNRLETYGARGMDISGNLLCLADDASGLLTLDVRDPIHPVRLGRIAMPGAAQAVHLADSTAYVAAGRGGLQIIDLRDPARPISAGQFRTSGSVQSVQAVGNRVFVADTTLGLLVIDVSDPANPIEMARLALGAGAYGVKVVNQTAFVAAGVAGLIVVDVSNPANPFRLGAYDTGGSAHSVAVQGNLAFVANLHSGLHIVDVAIPAQPVETGQYATSCGYYEVQVHGPHAYLADGDCGVHILDISDPSNPINLGGTYWSDARALRLAGHFLFVADTDADPYTPSELLAFEVRFGLPQTISWTGVTSQFLDLGQSYPLGATASSGLPVSLRVHGPAILADGAITVTGPGPVAVTAEQPGDATYRDAEPAVRHFNLRHAVGTPAGRLPVGQRASRVQLAGNRAYVTAASGGLHLFDLSDPDSPRLISRYATPAVATDFRVVENLAYVVSRGALEIVDLINPDSPGRRGTFATRGSSTSLDVASGYAYIADEASGLEVIDVRDPARPVRVGGYNTPGTARDIHVLGDYAYIADGGAGLQIIDIRNPASPRLAGTYDRSNGTSLDRLGDALAVQVVGRYAYLADGQAGMQVIDVRQPANPVRVGRADVPNFPRSVRVEGQYAYVALSTVPEVQVVDISNPAAPAIVGVIAQQDEAEDTDILNDRLYVADRKGLQVFKLAFGRTQTLAWTGTANEALGFDRPYALGAAASSGLPATVRVENGPATYANGEITATGSGTVTMTAEQAGDEIYLPVRITRHFNVRRAETRLLSQFDTPSFLKGLHIVGDYAYLADGRGVLILDVSDPAHPVHLSEYRVDSYCQGVWVSGNYAYLAAGDDGVHIIDVSDPANPVLAGHSATGNSASAVQVVGSIAYVANGSGGFVVLDVGDPQSPKLLTRISTGGFAVDIHVAEGFAYLTVQSSGLLVYDVKDPAKPIRIAQSDTAHIVSEVDAIGQRAYVAESQGLRVIDLADPARPVEWPGYGFPWGTRPHGLQLLGDYAYLAVDGYGYPGSDAIVGGGLRVIDISNPANSIEVGRHDTAARTEAVQVVGNRVYLAAGAAGLMIVEVSFRDPQSLDLELPANLPLQKKPIHSLGTATSGLPIVYSVVAGPATFEHGQLRLTGLGPVTLRAEQSGNEQYLPARAEWTINVTPPQLRVRRRAGKPELHWPAGLSGYKLQRADSLAPGTRWNDVSAAPLETDGEAHLPLADAETAAPHAFFRLVAP